jgi:hypothetical protein
MAKADKHSILFTLGVLVFLIILIVILSTKFIGMLSVKLIDYPIITFTTESLS